MRCRLYRQAKGFTLLEIIITLTVTAVLATMIFVYFGKAFTESVTPIARLRNAASLQRVMENITADYNVYPRWKSSTAYSNTGPSRVIPTNFNGYYYSCTVSGNSHTSDEPTWPLRAGTTVTDDSVTWAWGGRLRDLRSLTNLQTSIGAEGTDQDNSYGKYYVAKNGFTQFVNDVDQDSDSSGANNILKVTLRNDSGETVTALFFSE